MSNQSFYWVNLGIGLLLVLIFLIGKRGFVAPSKLNLRKGDPKAPQDSKAMVKATREVYTSASRYQTDPTEARVKNLNIMFVYNGHSFDAYEVLGAPAGANLEMVQRYYQAAVGKNGGDREFLDAAFQAIQASKRQ